MDVLRQTKDFNIARLDNGDYKLTVFKPVWKSVIVTREQLEDVYQALVEVLGEMRAEGKI